MMKIIKTIFITLILLFSMFRVGFCGGDDEVRVTIAALQQTYFNAVQSQDFATAYDMVTENMRDGRTKEKYVEDWEGVMKQAQVDLIEGGVTAIDVDGDKARVHAWTKASDVFNVIPIIEKEIDHWVLVNDVWKLDLTEVLMEE
ncbi:MAG: hypothetical protein CMF45_03480 [Legionellales bacterium]|nr:hypothetical protein [Legionellales bacterium]|tara:strand:- start:2630 stop:3061 length:432 start_codon:yes stop_codon:yes gene_type:complete